MSQQYSWPSSSSVTVSAIGGNGAPIPTTSILIAGEDPSLNLHPLQTDSSGQLLISSASLPLPTGAATAANQTTEINLLTARLTGSLVPSAFDEIDLTYVPSGNGAGQVATAVYKLATATIKTLTLSYNASNQLTSVVAS